MMKLVADDITRIAGKIKGFYKKSDNLRLIDEFANSRLTSARVINYSHKSAKSCASSLQATINRYKRKTIEAHLIENEVWLIKVSKYKQENT